jgi:hypothetical protein
MDMKGGQNESSYWRKKGLAMGKFEALVRDVYEGAGKKKNCMSTRMVFIYRENKTGNGHK